MRLKVPVADMRKAKLKKRKPDEMPKDSLLALNLTTGETTKLPNVKSFAFGKDAGSWLAVLQEGTPNKLLAEVKVTTQKRHAGTNDAHLDDDFGNQKRRGKENQGRRYDLAQPGRWQPQNGALRIERRRLGQWHDGVLQPRIGPRFGEERSVGGAGRVFFQYDQRADDTRGYQYDAEGLQGTGGGQSGRATRLDGLRRQCRGRRAGLFAVLQKPWPGHARQKQTKQTDPTRTGLPRTGRPP